MAFQRIGILSIGEMGYHWARLLASHGVEVLTYSKGRSEVTSKRAENAGARSVPSLARLVSESDLVVSVVVPSAAKRVAAKVAKALIKVGRK
ncbi:6-phosphogluconate dehydrogenase, partial [bacterium]